MSGPPRELGQGVAVGGRQRWSPKLGNPGDRRGNPAWADEDTKAQRGTESCLRTAQQVVAGTGHDSCVPHLRLPCHPQQPGSGSRKPCQCQGSQMLSRSNCRQADASSPASGKPICRWELGKVSHPLPVAPHTQGDHAQDGERVQGLMNPQASSTLSTGGRSAGLSCHRSPLKQGSGVPSATVLQRGALSSPKVLSSPPKVELPLKALSRVSLPCKDPGSQRGGAAVECSSSCSAQLLLHCILQQRLPSSRDVLRKGCLEG